MEPNTDDSLFGLKVDYEAASYFREASKWVKFISIVCFVLLGIVIMIFLFAGTMIATSLETAMPGFGMLGGGILIAIMIAACMLGVLLLILLYRFAHLTRQGIEREDQVTFNEGLKALKLYFIVTGVLALIGIVFSIFSNLTTLFI